jgi:hypothetical protein
MPDDTQTTQQTTDTVDIQKAIQAAVDQAVAGLKNKNAELLGEVKTAKESLRQWEGFDPETVRKIVTQFENDDEQKLIAAGKVNEVIEKRTRDTVTRSQAQVEKETRAREEATKRADDLQAKYHAAVIDNTVAQLVSGLADGALAPVQLFARQWFSIDEDGQVKPTSKAPLWPAAEPLTIDKLKEYLQATNSFYFKQPTGGGTVAGKTGGMQQKKRADMTAQERAKVIHEIGQDAYLSLP